MGAKNPLIYDKENYKNKSIMPFAKIRLGDLGMFTFINHILINAGLFRTDILFRIS